MLVDLHTHTNASDGALPATELVRRAEQAQLNMLAITDHDTVAGLREVQREAPSPCTIINGIELSTTWRNTAIHVLGLNIDIDNPLLNDGIDKQQIARRERATIIAERLAKAGFSGTFEGAAGLAGNAGISRPHFAQYLVDSGQVKSLKVAYSKHLGPGKPGDVKNMWASLEDVTDWIHAAGGEAVLAHPAKYRLTNMKMEELVADFRDCGGNAIEVQSGIQDAGLTRRLGKMANRFGLMASCGSDFHQPGQGWAELGSVTTVPADCTPVWRDWQLAPQAA